MLALQQPAMCATYCLALALPLSLLLLLLLLLLLSSTGHSGSSQRCWVCAGLPCLQSAGHHPLPGVTHPLSATGGTKHCQRSRHQHEDTVNFQAGYMCHL
jgi:hypothetical protein